MEEFTVEGDIVTITTGETRTIDLGKIKDEIKYLEAMVEPTDEEVLALAKKGEIHEYYRMNIELRLIELKEELEKWLSL